MAFSTTLWEDIADIYNSVLTHPFIEELAAGTLQLKTFQNYIIQDTNYLSDFARALAVTGSKAPVDKFAAELFATAKDIILVKRANLHEEFLREWDLDSATVLHHEKNQANTAYTNFLLRIAYDRPFHESLGALLPCFWIYWKVGMAIVRRQSSSNPYSRWIQTYSSQEYRDTVKKVIRMIDGEAEKHDQQERIEMMRRFRQSSVYEYLFWDCAYRNERWPFRLSSSISIAKRPA